ncbi:hypothetical protein D3C76_1109870 [compost metagenome]
MLFTIQISRQAGEQDEHRRTQVGEGAAEEQPGVGVGDVHRVADLTVQEEGFAHVVEQHEDNDQAAQGVDAEQALVGGWGGWHG